MMGKIAPALSFKAVEKLSKKEGLHAVGGCSGLYLQVKGNGASWILRVMKDLKRRDYGLGSYSDFSLEEARQKCAEMRKKVRSVLALEFANELSDEEDRLCDAGKRLRLLSCLTVLNDQLSSPSHAPAVGHA